jgi:hypothetical protein
VNHAGANAALEALRPPDALVVGHVATAAGLHRHRISSAWATGHGDEDILTEGRAGVDRAAEALAQPQLFAGLGIESCETSRKTDDEFLASVRGDQDGRTPRCAPATHASTHTAASTSTTASKSSSGATLSTRAAGLTSRSAKLRARQGSIESIAELCLVDSAGLFRVPCSEPFCERSRPLLASEGAVFVSIGRREEARRDEALAATATASASATWALTVRTICRRAAATISSTKALRRRKHIAQALGEGLLVELSTLR